MTLKRLGQVNLALSGGRFITADLAARLAADLPHATVAPALSLRAGLTHNTTSGVNRAGGVAVYGVDARLWNLLERRDIPPPKANEVVLNERVAATLGVQPGDAVSLNIELPTAIPRESLLGERNDLTRELPLTVAAVLPESLGAGRFGLNPGQQVPPVAFVNLAALQQTLDLAAVRASRRNPVAQPGRVNSLYVAGEESKPTAAENLTHTMQRTLTLDDLGLKLVPVPERNYLSLESRRMILEQPIEDAARRAANDLHAATSPVYVYLVNELASAHDPTQHAAYSVVAGVDFKSLNQQPFEPLNYRAGGPPTGPGQIVLNTFAATEQLKVDVGDSVVMKYFAVGSHGELPEESRTFRVCGIVDFIGAAADRHLTPTLAGITDAETFSDWDQPFEMDMSRITPADERYWDEYRATPKALVPLAAAQALFASRYGRLTSFRVAVPQGQTTTAFADKYERQLLESVDVNQLGLAFRPVKFEGLQAAAGTTDFSGLFVGFSFFLILSAAILIGLLFRLGIEQRAASIGLLEAVGFTPAAVRWQMLAEGLAVVLLGAAVGTVAAILYAALMIHALTTWWIGAIGTRFLFLDVRPRSLAIGFAVAVVVAAVAVWWGLRRLKQVTPRALLAGATAPEPTVRSGRKSGRYALLTMWIAGGLALILVVGGLFNLIPATEAFSGFSWQVVAFFLAGALSLTAAMAGLAWMLGRDREGALHSATGLGFRNAARNRTRSVMTVGLIASATFVLVAVAASRRDPSAELPQQDSGNGGFLLVGQSSTPLPFDLDTAAGREKLGIRLPADSPQAALLASADVYSCRLREGDDASCLNLYRTGLPTVLGVPENFIGRGGFKFISTPGENPWTLLNKPAAPEQVAGQTLPTYPVFGDANTLLYSLKKGIGDVLLVPEDNPRYALRIAGMLDGSVFQGVLLMSEKNFTTLYPEQAGYGYFLVEAPPVAQVELSNLLETELTPFGFDVEPVADRIADFLAVQNTYLSTFQALGGLGLLLGTVGLGTVMLRNVLERRAELALLRAVGFSTARLTMLVLLETALLLAWGLVAGTVAALLAVGPHLTGRGADLPVASGAFMLAAVAVTGLLAALLAVRAAVRTPLVAALRGE